VIVIVTFRLGIPSDVATSKTVPKLTPVTVMEFPVVLLSVTAPGVTPDGVAVQVIVRLVRSVPSRAFSVAVNGRF
jgi:hypothetical protein